MRYCGNKICPDKQTDERGGLQNQEMTNDSFSGCWQSLKFGKNISLVIVLTEQWYWAWHYLALTRMTRAKKKTRNWSCCCK